MRAGKTIAAVALTGLISLSAVYPAFAIEKPDGMDDITWARLQDGIIEYDEIENLVVYFNPSYRQGIEQMDAATGIQHMEQSVSDLKKEIKNIKDEAEFAKEENDMALYMYNTALADSLEKKALKPFNSAVKIMNSQKKDTFQSIKRQLTSGIQQLMISYHMLLASKELTDTGVELAEAAHQSTITQKGLGMATDTAVQNAEKALVSAKKQQQSVDNNLLKLRQNLSIMTGGSYDTPVEVGAIPAPDLGRIETMNPELDMDTAVIYNSDVQAAIHLDERAQAKYDLKYLTLDESKGRLKTKLESLYQTVLENKTAYEAAQTAFESAKITMNGNDLKYQMGMLGRLEYLQAKLGYLQQKMTYDMAVLNLKQAIENYDWALYGVVALD